MEPDDVQDARNLFARFFLLRRRSYLDEVPAPGEGMRTRRGRRQTQLASKLSSDDTRPARSTSAEQIKSSREHGSNKGERAMQLFWHARKPKRSAKAEPTHFRVISSSNKHDPKVDCKEQEKSLRKTTHNERLRHGVANQS